MSQLPNENNNQNDSNNHDGRGHPREYPKSKEEGDSCILLNDPNIPRRVNSLNPLDVPPSFKAIFSKRLSEKQENHSNVVKVGNIVPALIEGEIDGGYWLSIGNGSSDTPLRGIIFKPESPIYAKLGYNKAAAGVFTNTRNEGKNVVINSRNEAIKRNEQPSIMKVDIGKDQTSNPHTTSNVVPIMMKSAQPPQAMNQAFLGNRKNISKDIPIDHGQQLGSIPTINMSSPAALMKPFLEDGNLTLLASTSPKQTSQMMLSRGKQVENVECHQSSAKEVVAKETMSLRDPSMPFDLDIVVNAVINRLLNHSDLKDIVNCINNLGGKAIKVEETNNDMDESMPLQNVHDDRNLQPHTVYSSRPFKMTRFMQDKGNREPEC
ncbi:hypothetical protein SESBI_35476 [Sesbania bispinosa]|nr:hypothetical protein SESBI_35476 [Sesbania bispinosa]